MRLPGRRADEGLPTRTEGALPSPHWERGGGEGRRVREPLGLKYAR
jgi:hypothetical protein